MVRIARAATAGNDVSIHPISAATALASRIALIVGAKTFDRLFAGIHGSLLYVHAKNEETAAEIEDNYALQIAIVASKIIGQEVEVVVVLPKVLQYALTMAWRHALAAQWESLGVSLAPST